MEPDPRLAREAARNLDSQGLWDSFTSHRQRVTDLLAAAAPGKNSRLCVLGAGNCNDLDLARLRKVFEKIELIDWDAAALRHGVATQSLADDPHIILTGGVDLLGENKSLKEPADVVASVCLLSQLLEQVADKAGTNSPEYPPAVQAARLQHLQLLIDLARPGGTAILVTDVTSSTTAPELLSAGDRQLAPLLAKLLAERNFFTGLNPAVLLDALKTDTALAPKVDRIQPIPPWRWQFRERVYAVYAVQFRRIEVPAS